MRCGMGGVHAAWLLRPPAGLENVPPLCSVLILPMLGCPPGDLQAREVRARLQPWFVPAMGSPLPALSFEDL